MSRQVAIVKIGYQDVAIPVDGAKAGAILTLFSKAFLVRNVAGPDRLYRHYRCEKEPLEVEVKLVDASRILPPRVDDNDSTDITDVNGPKPVKRLRGAAQLLLKGGA